MTYINDHVPEEKCGEWYMNPWGEATCTECNYSTGMMMHYALRDFIYCPHCGIKMKPKEQES